MRNLYIYIIIHPKFAGWLKLGRTISLSKRISHYNTCCPQRSFKYAYYKRISIEKIISIENYFSINVPSNGCEWYKCSLEEAIITIENIINEILVPITKENTKKTSNIQYTYYITDPMVLGEYAYLDEIKVYNLPELLKVLNTTTTSLPKISELFQKSKNNTIEYKDKIIKRKKFIKEMKD